MVVDQSEPSDEPDKTYMISLNRLD